ncbi:Ger(x)C family spore germination protein [Orenia marismortui]|uniref:Ger(X)C family germination protein n=1 Tax=Orenia marismortui TaxID=46469 RepID=A0A4R8H8T7_9FIRM|nr:Ger(x)C family spore germination protein [Orenia marismortui]TDX51757.1 Ger(x)C family germination protein [Orenia marismortui]
MRKIVKLLIIIMLINLLTGCWDRRDIEETVPVLGIGIDFIKEEERELTKSSRVKVTVQIPIPANMEQGEDVVWVMSSVGESIAGAIDNLQNKLNQELFFGHLQLIIFSQDVAKEGINKFLNYFRNLPQIRRLSWLLISENNAEDIIKSEPKLESIQALYLSHMLNNGAKTGRIPDLRLGDFFIRLSNPGQESTVVMIKANKEIIDYIGLAVFDGDEFVGSLDQPETLYYQRLMGTSGSGSNLVLSSDPTTEIDPLTIQIQEVSSKIRPIVKNKELKMNINIKVEAKVIEQLNQSNLGREKIVHQIEKRIENKIKSEVDKVIRKTQKKFQSDVWGFGEYVRAYYPSYWQKISWKQKYSNIKFNLEVKAYIRQVGMIKFEGK